MHLPQKQFHKLYKAIAPFCRRPSEVPFAALVAAQQLYRGHASALTKY